MSKKFKSQASSARAASSLNGAFAAASSFQTNSSSLAYVAEGPDLTRISNPDIVVAFKNLSKRDSTTKAKALEELVEHLGSPDCEESILSAWCDIYPRTSIDNSRRVRQLAHTIQGTLTSLCGRRIAPLIKKVVGPWLAGTFDSDKIVARAASAALEKSFTSAEKRNALWKVYREALIGYAEDAILVQTVATLSDERITSPDDAEAKYVRVAGTGMYILAHLLEDSIETDAAATFITEKKLWTHVSHHDPYLRRGVCRLVGPVCQQYSGVVDWKILSSNFLSKGLQSNQTGSFIQFIEALFLLTECQPELWTADYVSKSPVSKRLHQFLKKGTQHGPERSWPALGKLIQTIPTMAWATDKKAEDAGSLLDTVRAGVSQPSERGNATIAWSTYVNLAFWLVTCLDDQRDHFADMYIAPIVLHYIAPDQNQQWIVPKNASRLCAAILRRLFEHDCQPSFDKTWNEIVDVTNNAMKMSLPESSKEFRSSQEAVMAQANRLFSVMRALNSLSSSHPDIIAATKSTQMQLLNSALELLVARNGKPYAAASIVDSLVQQPEFDKQNTTLQNFVRNDLLHLINSPSAEQLTSIALASGSSSVIKDLLQKDIESTIVAVKYLTKHVSEEQMSAEMQSALQHRIAFLRTTTSREIAISVLSNQKLKEAHQMVIHEIQASLSPDAPYDSQDGALKILNETLDSSEAAEIFAGEDRQSIMSKLLVLSDSSTTFAEESRLVASKMDSKDLSTKGSQSIIHQQLGGEGPLISIFTLIELAENALEKGSSYDEIFPTEQQWQQALAPYLSSTRPFELAVTSPLQGVVYMLTPSKHSQPKAIIDAEGLSNAFRLSLYTTKLLSKSTVSNKKRRIAQIATQKYLPIAMVLINEKISDENANEIWLQSVPEILQEAVDVVSDGNRLIQSWLQDDAAGDATDSDDYDFVDDWIGRAVAFEDTTCATYCEALAWIDVVSQVADQTGPNRIVEQYDQDLKSLTTSQHVIRSAALLAVLRESLSTTSSGKRLSNELVANATGSRTDLKPLVLLNLLLNGQQSALEAIPNQRIVFLLKNLVSMLTSTDTLGLEAESTKLLAAIAPLVSGIYGEHWMTTLQYLSQIWQSEPDVTLMNATLRLYSKLQNLSYDEDTNEDLSDALATCKQDLVSGLVDCLFLLASHSGSISQPRNITAELLRRLVKDATPPNQAALFDLLSSRVEGVQNAAYEILHKTIPKSQEELSIDLVLEKRTGHLPNEIMVNLADSSNQKQYLISWILVFDHFTSASHMLRECYSTDVKQSGYLDNFLDFICEIIRISSGRPIDASKFDILNFGIDDQETAEKEIQHMAIHAFYDVLLFLPSLAKEWFISQKNRIKAPLESWTQKYISPFVVATSTSAVMKWASTQSDDERPLEVKLSPKGSEVVASIEIDPENQPISLAVSLPGTYPFDPPTVTSRTRVGVSEKNWQSWLRTIQIIIFSTGSIIEGLIAFRHNVQGALKGQSECAICYSIIGTDKQTPNKKCNTCKNMFHGSCLFRWFKSSNSSSCPLCRNNFNYA